MSTWPPVISRRAQWMILIVIALLAFGLRAFGYGQSPGGWRDDELSNALVVSQHVRDGEVRLYYDDASGHEGLYHWLQAGTMTIFGPGIWGIRGVSILFGTLTIILTFLIVTHLFDWPTAALTALLMAVSFWSLMYSRSGQRHISVLVTSLLSFYFLWRALQEIHSGAKGYRHFALAGVCMGAGFYTYFAARGLPLIVIGWGIYLLIWKRDEFQAVWRGLLVTLLTAILLALPLIITLQQQPEAEARVAELAKPIYDARDGDFSTLGQFTVTTLSMFTHDGDDEVLYNLPHRPVFSLLGGLLFWAGVLVSAFRTFGPDRDSRYAFLLLWLGAGLSPGILSVPAASLGHTLLAQPVAYIMPALALSEGLRWLVSHQPNPRLVMASAAVVLTLILFGWETLRGLRDYFIIWPQDSFGRVLHHADLHDAARWLNTQPDTQDVAIGSFLTERWDQQVMTIDLDGEDWQVRAFDPRTTYVQTANGGMIVLPEYLVEGWGIDQLGEPRPVDGRFVAYPLPRTEEHDPIATFERGLTLDQVEAERTDDHIALTLGWQVTDPLDLPPFPLFSKPPAPDEDATPRLAIFTQVLDETGQRIAGADALGVDPYTLLPGDRFIQHFEIALGDLPPGDYRLILGLYDPLSGERWLITGTGSDHVELEVWSQP